MEIYNIDGKQMDTTNQMSCLLISPQHQPTRNSREEEACHMMYSINHQNQKIACLQPNRAKNCNTSCHHNAQSFQRSLQKKKIKGPDQPPNDLQGFLRLANVAFQNHPFIDVSSIQYLHLQGNLQCHVMATFDYGNHPIESI